MPHIARSQSRGRNRLAPAPASLPTACRADCNQARRTMGRTGCEAGTAWALSPSPSRSRQESLRTRQRSQRQLMPSPLGGRPRAGCTWARLLTTRWRTEVCPPGCHRPQLKSAGNVLAGNSKTGVEAQPEAMNNTATTSNSTATRENDFMMELPFSKSSASCVWLARRHDRAEIFDSPLLFH